MDKPRTEGSSEYASLNVWMENGLVCGSGALPIPSCHSVL